MIISGVLFEYKSYWIALKPRIMFLLSSGNFSK